MADSAVTRFTHRQDLDRDLNELEGLVRGIALDGRVVREEADSLERWCSRERSRKAAGPLREACDLIREAVSDGFLDDEERADILHLCGRLKSPSPFYSVATADMQRLHGLLAGVGADGLVNEAELRGLREWIEGIQQLRGTWPYDEIDALVTSVLSDGRIDEQEQRFLAGFTREFLNSTRNLVLEAPFDEELVRHGVCAVQPEIAFPGRHFCITGSSRRVSRKQIESVIVKLGGLHRPRVTRDLNYLVVAADRSLSWAFSCYGRKVEAAMVLRKEGSDVAIVHESDFWDAAADLGIEPPSRQRPK